MTKDHLALSEFQNSMHITKKSATAAVAVLTVVIIGTAVLFQKNQQAQQKSADLLVKTVVVEPAAVSGEIEASGMVVALRRINISPASPGRIRRLLFREGDRVSAGQLLAVMENDEQRSQVLQIEAELEGATAEQAADKQRLIRFEKLLSEGAVSPDEVDELRKISSRSESSVTEVRERLKEANILFDRTHIRAPFSGVITQLFAEVLEFVAPATSASTGAGATSTTIAELSRGLEVEAKIPEANLLSISIGQQARITSTAFPGKVFNGTVKSISPRAVSADNVISFPVRVGLNDDANSLRPEMNVAVSFIESESRRSLAVPLAAIETEKNGQSFVYVYKNQSGPERRAVTLGSVSESVVEIVDGLQAGERVYISPPGYAGASQ